MNEVDPIEKTMNELVFLLKYNGERHWSSMFEKLLEEYHNATLKKVAIKKILDVYKGGMGYFNDLVLLRNYVIPIGFSLRETVGEQE